MENKIRATLKGIEKEKNVEILFAVESGSRAWGFASTDSDYDIRFVYQQKREVYLSLWESQDTIQFMTEDDLDGSGWDLRKALKLLAKSNTSILEWLYSPIVYIDNPGVLKDFRKLAEANFNPVSGFHHYHNMNKGFDEILGSEKMTLKSYFYAIRTALCARWILRSGTIPPVKFTELLGLLDVEHQQKLHALVEVKYRAKEKDRGPADQQLIALAKAVAKENSEKREEVKKRRANLDDFDALFLQLVQ